MNTTLPTDSNERKTYALFSGCLKYFPAALAGVAKTSKLGNDKHNPGQEMHHARNKSGDHGDCVIRHLMDLSDLLAANDRGTLDNKNYILTEVDCLAWRALALSQELHEKFGAPLAPGAKVDTQPSKEEPKKVERLKSNLPVGGPGVDLWEAADRAHDDITARLKQNKIDAAKKLFSKGDVIKHISNDAEVTVEALYYDEKGNPILFVRDADEKIFGVDPTFYKSIYKEKEA